MASPGSRPQTIRFGLFELDVGNRELLKRGSTVKLQPRQFDILLMLVEHAGQVVSRDEIRERIWDADTFVDFERSINFAINQIRAALRDDPEKLRFIETLPKRGYRFIATIERERTPETPRGPVFIDRKPMTSPHRQPESALPEFEEPPPAAQPAAEIAPTPAAPASRKTPRIFIETAGAALLVTIFGVLWLRSRSAPSDEIKEQQLTRNANDNPITSVTVSPDGKYLAYSDLGGLHVKLLPTGEVHDFPQPPELGKSRAQWLVSWLPDSARFLAVAFGLGVPPSTWQASVVSGSLRILRKDAVTWSVSPDGSQFVFTDTNEQAMWLMDIGGDRPRKVADAGARNWFSYIEWSPMDRTCSTSSASPRQIM